MYDIKLVEKFIRSIIDLRIAQGFKYTLRTDICKHLHLIAPHKGYGMNPFMRDVTTVCNKVYGTNYTKVQVANGGMRKAVIH